MNLVSDRHVESVYPKSHDPRCALIYAWNPSPGEVGPGASLNLIKSTSPGSVRNYLKTLGRQYLRNNIQA